MIKIEKIIPGGQALGTHEDGRKIFFWNALPDEIVDNYTITKKKSHYYEAIAEEIHNPSKYRIVPKDTCYLSTSPWQIISYDYELQLKQELVIELFREHNINIESPQISTDNHDYFYRNKMEYSLYWDKEKELILPAFHARNSHRKIPITSSSIERPEIFQSAIEIIDSLNQRKEPAYKYQSLLLRCNQSGEVSGGLYENHKPHPTFPNLTDVILDRTYSYSPNGFFQINLPVYEKALVDIKSHIVTDEVLDLYSGVGTIGLSTAYNKRLTLVECDKYAYNEMIKNITANKLSVATEDKTSQYQFDNITAILDKSENVINHIHPNQTVILDPPRSGCDVRLINRLNEVIPQTIIYLSCNPATQARDVKILLNHYQIDMVKAYNFFPRTPHIENLVILHKS